MWVDPLDGTKEYTEGKINLHTCHNQNMYLVLEQRDANSTYTQINIFFYSVALTEMFSDCTLIFCAVLCALGLSGCSSVHRFESFTVTFFLSLSIAPAALFLLTPASMCLQQHTEVKIPHKALGTCQPHSTAQCMGSK